MKRKLMSRLLLVIFVITVMFSAFMPINAEESNLVTNGSFETGDTTGWTNWGGEKIKVVSDDTAQDGNYYLKVTDGSYSMFFLTDLFVVGNTYKISFYYRGTGSINLYGGQDSADTGDGYFAGAPSLDSDADWTYYEVDRTALGSGNFQFKFTGDVDLDNIVIIGTTTSTPTPVPTIGAGEWGIDTTKFQTTLDTMPERAWSSLKEEMPQQGSSAYLEGVGRNGSVGIVLTKGCSNVAISCASDSDPYTPFEIGKTYRISFWHKGGKAKMALSWKTTMPSLVTENDEDWTQYSFTYTPTDEADLVGYYTIGDGGMSDGEYAYCDDYTCEVFVPDETNTDEPKSTQIVGISSVNVALNGTWENNSYSLFEGGSAIKTDRNGDTIEFKFTGSSLAINAYKSPTQGSIGITIDGEEVQVVDLVGEQYDTVVETVYSVDTLEDREHEVIISAISNKRDTKTNSGLKNQYGNIGWINPMINIDAIAIENEETLEVGEIKSIVYQSEKANGWDLVDDMHFSARSAIKSTATTAQTLTYSGIATTVKIYGYKSISQGKIYVKLIGENGVIEEKEVELRSATVDTEFIQVYTKTVENAEEITVEITNAGGNVYVDYVEFVK